MKLEKAYDPKKYEGEIYKTWEDSEFFNPDKLPGERKDPFCIVLPPPNVTGMAHMGHVLAATVQDIIIRYQRMSGKKTLWLPGTDHAAIATQSKVEKKLYDEEGKTRHDLGREEFLKRVEAFAQESHDTIVSQHKRFGASLDWSRKVYTLDEERSHAVRTVFKKMYDDGLIYRGNRVVNWDPVGQTTVSDDEVEHKETTGKLYYFKYEKDFPITIATTRPETKLGDTAVAVNPNDKRYKDFVGKTYNVNFAGADLLIKIIADEEVDADFGTGALGVTPAHSIVDWEMSKRHDLPLKQVIDENAKITSTGTRFDGKSIDDARKKIVEWLENENLLEKTEEVPQNLAIAERTNGVIEPLPKLQWFVDVNKPIKDRGNKSLKDLMRQAVESGEIKIVPERFEKVYFHWIDNLRDWNISRQIWFGHQVPVWYRSANGKTEEEVFVGTKPPKESGWEQDPDTLDTWFSSGLWTFSTLGWPEKTNNLATFHPTDVLETGYDILFFWVARMILMSTYCLGEVPFKTVYLHGLVRDEKGRKLSKSLGNFIDPVEIIEEFGADALRMALVVANPAGSDTNIGDEKIKSYKHFANKIWNASKFVLMNMDGFEPKEIKIGKELEKLTKEVTDHIENYRFHLASEQLYHYFWHTFADKIIEEQKNCLRGESEKEKTEAQQLLYSELSVLLRLLHPFMPFVTEKIWSHLPGEKSDLLIVAPWPANHKNKRL